MSSHKKFIIQQGLISGSIYVILYLSGVYSGSYTKGWFNLLNYLLPSLFILVMLIRYRSTFPDGALKFSTAYRISFFTMLVSTIVFSFFSFYYLNHINPGLVDEQMETVLQSYEEKGLDEEVYSSSINFTRKMMTNFWLSVPLGIIFGAMINAIVSLIIAAIAKKEGEDPFAQTEA